MNPNLETFVINTHFHWDPILGNVFFEKKKILQHSLCKAFTELYWDEMMQMYESYQQGRVRKTEADMYIEQEYEINGELLLFHSPGHTEDGLSNFYNKRKALFVDDNKGDDDIQIVPVLDCRIDAYSKTIDKYRRLKAKYVFSGHNEVSDKDIFEKILARIQYSDSFACAGRIKSCD